MREPTARYLCSANPSNEMRDPFSGSNRGDSSRSPSSLFDSKLADFPYTWEYLKGRDSTHKVTGNSKGCQQDFLRRIVVISQNVDCKKIGTKAD